MSNKWEREIEDLLRKKYSDDEREPPPPTPLKRRDPQKPPKNDWRRLLHNLSASRLVWYGLGLAIASYVLRPFFGPAILLLALASVGLIVAGIFVSVVQRERPYVEKRWRGQIVEMPRRPGPLTLLWRRLTSFWRRRFDGKR
jgi:hypothetical protein